MSNLESEPIPQIWVRDYIDKLIATAKDMPEGDFKQAILFRADNAMDLVKAFRESKTRNSDRSKSKDML